MCFFIAVFFVSHLVRSSGALIGIGIALFIVLDFLWSLILFSLTVLVGATSSSAVALQLGIYAGFFNPAQFVSLVYDYLMGSASGTVIQASSYGLTITTLVGDAIFWVAAPLIVYLYLATNRD